MSVAWRDHVLTVVSLMRYCPSAFILLRCVHWKWDIKNSGHIVEFNISIPQGCYREQISSHMRHIVSCFTTVSSALLIL